MSYDPRKGTQRSRPSPWSATTQGQGTPQSESIETPPVKIALPEHLFIPEDSQSFDARRLVDVAPVTTVTLVQFTVPEGSILVVQSYAIFNDGLLAADYDFVPTVNGQRVYPYQGDSLDKFRIYLGVSVDLGNEALLEGYLVVKPGQTLKWIAINRSALATTMGVRVKGFITHKAYKDKGFGG